MAAATVLVSCKDDEDDSETLPYLTGSPRFEVDRYVTPGTKVKVTPQDVTNPTGAEITYSWSVTRGGDEVFSSQPSEESDGKSLVYTFEGAVEKDTLCNFTLSCTTSATGYYGTSYSAVVTTVNENSMTYEGDSAINGDVVTGTVTDPRTAGSDTPGDEYATVTVDGLEWLAENLHYAGTADEPAGTALEKSEAVSDIFGRFYTWEEAQDACSGLGTGWRLPTVEDWDALAGFFTEETGADGEETAEADGYPALWKGVTGKLMTNVYFNHDRMWEYWPEVKITNESGFSIIPVGFATVVDNSRSNILSFDGLAEYAGFWTGTEYGEAGSPSAYYVYLWDENPDLRLNYVDKVSFALPVRCVRDK